MDQFHAVGEWLVLEGDDQKPQAYIRRDEIVAIEVDRDTEGVEGYVNLLVYLRDRTLSFEGWVKAALLD